jgi:ribonuclease D
MPTAPPITTSAELVQALQRLAAADFIALDTEFMRESTYYPKLCLIQAAVPGYCALIDPLSTLDLLPLWHLLAQNSRVKVLHAARQDLEVLALSTGDSPMSGPVFDTQIAAALLGHPAQAGYGALVEAQLGHKLQKGHTRTDWSARPLSPEQLDYAEDDVRYLVPLYTNLRDALISADRLAWLAEETRELEQPQFHRVEPELAWRRLKGLDRLQPLQRAAAKLLAEWRESAAILHDKPRGWILADEALREIADRLPGNAQELAQVRTVPPGVVRKRGSEIVALIERARGIAANEGAASFPQRPAPQQQALVNRMMSFTRTLAEELKISPETLATRRDVEQLVFSGRTERLLSGWRKKVIGEQLVAML